MEVIKGQKRRKRGRIIILVVIAAFLIYAIFSIISQQIQISQKETQLAQIQQELSEQNLKNEELKNALDNGIAESGDYIKRIARQRGFAFPGEQIFENISGN